MRPFLQMDMEERWAEAHPTPTLRTPCKPVGWVEHGETHAAGPTQKPYLYRLLMGFASLAERRPTHPAAPARSFASRARSYDLGEAQAALSLRGVMARRMPLSSTP
ncbi:hypothetical protein TUM18999_53510 [Pseudomonas tohonis]|uniref:Uncharacterized protein n=1 Tax=Pseudomonas tohonis TaxID=2725477 RepID=A0A6J4EC08_9PSED|nr:hypothetical protein TUM18999_53510 [Pseudomonas tohonis]GJN54595.1 hypothetical protein TUM20286_43470 [Pseudomonas tohonis]